MRNPNGPSIEEIDAWKDALRDADEARTSEREKPMNKTRELLLQQIDEATEPNRMKPADALDFLSTLMDDLTGRIEALREENPELARQ